MKLRIGIALAGLLAIAPAAISQQAQRPPIIDMHLHAYAEQDWKRPPNPVTGVLPPETATGHLRACLEAMDRYNIVLAVVSGSLEGVAEWRKAAPERILGSPMFGRPGVDYIGRPLPDLSTLRRMYRKHQLKAMAEVVAQYEGLSPSDPSLDPYFAMAEELGIPVGFHTGTSLPGMPYAGAPRFRLALGNPLLLEDLLVRHPKLPVYIMHGGEPWTRETLAVMRMYPQLYMDVAVIDWIEGPKGTARFHEFLRQMIAEGLGKRIMFGTDQMQWPDAIGLAIASIESADFLTAEEKRDIFYNNAARFLKIR